MKLPAISDVEPGPSTRAAPYTWRGARSRLFAFDRALGGTRALPVRAVAALALVAFAATAVVMMLWWPLGYDQGIFAFIGAVVLDGGLPYRDAFETRGPLAFYLFAGIASVLGRTAFAIRLFDVALLVAAAALLWVVARQLISRVAAGALVVFWSLYVVSWSYNDTAQPDLWVAYAIFACVALVAGPRDARWGRLVCSGGLVGLCALTKPFYLAFLLTPLVADLSRNGWGPARIVRTSVVLAAGAGAPIAVALAALYGSGAFPDFVDVHVLYNARVYAYVKALSPGARLATLLGFVQTSSPLNVALPFAGVGFAHVWRHARPLAAALLSMVLVGTGCVLLQGKFWFYHWAPVLLPVALLTAIGIAVLLHRRSADPAPRRTAAWVAVAFILVGVSLRPAAWVRRWALHVAGGSSPTEYNNSFGVGWGVNPGDQMLAAAYVRERTAPGTPVAVWGTDAAIPFLAGRPPVSRFPVTRLFIFAPDAPQTIAYRREFVERMRLLRPPFLVVGRHDELRQDKVPQPISAQMPELGEFVDRHYQFERRIGDIDVYRFASAPSLPGPTE